jgi:diguanylate cyclase (GGDEF)-like protein/PAS domain S-box-containing protein
MQTDRSGQSAPPPALPLVAQSQLTRDDSFGKPSWSAPAGLLAGGIGLIYVAAGATALVSVLFPPAKFGSPALAAFVAVAALVIGAVLLAFRSTRFGQANDYVLGLATLTVSLGVYAGGAPSSGAMFFYLWIVPYAFALLSRRRALAQAAWMAVCSAAVIALQVERHPTIGSGSELAGMWMIAIATVLAVGLLVRGLSRSLRDADRRFHRAFQDSQVGAAFVSTDGRWLDANDALCRMLGRRRSDLLGTSLFEITAPDDRESTLHAVARASQGFFEYEKRYLRPNGEIVWVEVSASMITPETGHPYLFAQYRDVTAHKRDRETLARQAVHDPLTGLYNRTLLLDRLQTALGRGEKVGVVLLDLDGFKFVNDSLGHQAGDQALIAMAPKLAAATAATDTLARLGGDEFVVLCEQLTSPLDAIDRANRLAIAVANTPIHLTTGRHTLTASIGVATAEGPTDTPNGLLRDADAAMYRAKAKGRGRIELFDQTMRDEALARLQLEHDLQVAIEESQFILDYQPIVDTHTLRPVAVEALIRWDHPTRGRLAPGEFIPLAEETGLIGLIGDWVVTTACRDLVEWQSAGRHAPIQVCVNVSPVQLSIDGFVEQIAHVLRRSHLAPGSLCLEITETAILSDEAPVAALNALKALGIRILLDDFGTGYSSLAYLTRYPIDTLKIDQAFTHQLDGTTTNAAITKAILAIANELCLGIVAEGVETREQLRQLRRLNCPHVQGRAICYPLAAADVPLYLEQHTRQRRLRLTSTA